MGPVMLCTLCQPPPTNAAELAAAVNLNDFSDIHDKSGVLLCAETQNATLRDVNQLTRHIESD